MRSVTADRGSAHRPVFRTIGTTAGEYPAHGDIVSTAAARRRPGVIGRSCQWERPRPARAAPTSPRRTSHDRAHLAVARHDRRTDRRDPGRPARRRPQAPRRDHRGGHPLGARLRRPRRRLRRRPLVLRRGGACRGVLRRLHHQVAVGRQPVRLRHRRRRRSRSRPSAERVLLRGICHRPGDARCIASPSAPRPSTRSSWVFYLFAAVLSSRPSTSPGRAASTTTPSSRRTRPCARFAACCPLPTTTTARARSSASAGGGW